MKKEIFFGTVLFAVVAFTSCKSSESAYKKAYERAKLQESEQTQTGTTTQTAVTPINKVTPVKQVTSQEFDTQPVVIGNDVRQIQGGVTVVKGSGLKNFSVIVGSFSVMANAESLQSKLIARGYNAQVLHSNETINGHTGWYRVAASTYNDKASAAQSRDSLRKSYTGAWLLYNK